MLAVEAGARSAVEHSWRRSANFYQSVACVRRPMLTATSSYGGTVVPTGRLVTQCQAGGPTGVHHRRDHGPRWVSSCSVAVVAV
jgi:hypothetical protein